jgi:hypothetical protein
MPNSQKPPSSAGPNTASCRASRRTAWRSKAAETSGASVPMNRTGPGGASFEPLFQPLGQRAVALAAARQVGRPICRGDSTQRAVRRGIDDRVAAGLSGRPEGARLREAGNAPGGGRTDAFGQPCLGQTDARRLGEYEKSWTYHANALLSSCARRKMSGTNPGQKRRPSDATPEYRPGHGRRGLPVCLFHERNAVHPEGEAVRLDEASAILVCSDEDDCARTVPNRGNKGYLMMPPPEEDEDEEPMGIRFIPLMDTAVGPVWLTEIRMVEDDETAYVVGVTRRAPEFDADGLKAFDVELPWCGDVSEEEREAYGIEKLDSYTCGLPTETSISDYLRAAHKSLFRRSGLVGRRLGPAAALMWNTMRDADVVQAVCRLRVVCEELDRQGHQQLAPGFLRDDGPELIV